MYDQWVTSHSHVALVTVVLWTFLLDGSLKQHLNSCLWVCPAHNVNDRWPFSLAIPEIARCFVPDVPRFLAGNLYFRMSSASIHCSLKLYLTKLLVNVVCCMIKYWHTGAKVGVGEVYNKGPGQCRTIQVHSFGSQTALASHLFYYTLQLFS